MNLMPNELVAKTTWDDMRRGFGFPDSEGDPPYGLTQAVRHARMEIVWMLRERAKSDDYDCGCQSCMIVYSELIDLADAIEAAALEEL